MSGCVESELIDEMVQCLLPLNQVQYILHTQALSYIPTYFFHYFFQRSEDEAHDTQLSEVESLASENSADEVYILRVLVSTVKSSILTYSLNSYVLN